MGERTYSQQESEMTKMGSREKETHSTTRAPCDALKATGDSGVMERDLWSGGEGQT